MDILIRKVNPKDEEMVEFLTEENFNLFVELKAKTGLMYNQETMDYMKDYTNEIIIKAIDKDALIYAAYLENKIIGCGFINGKGYLYSLFVKEEYRNRGIGSKLLGKLIEKCNHFDIIKVDARIDAVSLYERFSFQKKGVANGRSVPMELERSHYGK